MKKYFVFFLFPLLLKSQEAVFEFKEILANKQETYNKLKFVKNKYFYEDENYKVRETCSGEWGGTIYFKDKKTNLETAASATCVININKIDKKYYVTSALLHRIAHTKIIEIEKPKNLEVFKLLKPVGFNKGRKIYSVEQVESQSEKGTKKILDSSKVLTLASFVFNKRLYHIYTDTLNVYLAKIEDHKFVNILKIYNKGIFEFKQNKTKDGHLILYFKREDEEGYFDIQENKIILTKFN